jgi:hypothetical protein
MRCFRVCRQTVGLREAAEEEAGKRSRLHRSCKMTDAPPPPNLADILLRIYVEARSSSSVISFLQVLPRELWDEVR